MAQQKIVMLVDDLDGTEASETVTFAIDGITYEIDLSEKNATALREALRRYVAAAREAGAQGDDGQPRVPNASTGASVDAENRAWARRNGHPGPARGPIAQPAHAAADLEGKGNETRPAKAGRPAIVGKENWLTRCKTRECVDQDGTCALHFRRPPRVPDAPKSLLARNPELARRLNQSLTGFRADQVSHKSSTALAVWDCVTGEHTFCSTPLDVSRNVGRWQGCSICAGKVVQKERSLAAVAPDLVEQWDSMANGAVTPDRVAPQSNALYWWRCKVADDHRWRASPNNRYGKGSGCPMCAGKKPSSTNNATLNPRLLESWSIAHNSALGIDPWEVTLGSGKTVWWRCRNNASHADFPMTVWKRALGGGCPRCSGHVLTAERTIAAVAPHLVDEFDIQLNNGRTADQVAAGSNKDVHWRCSANPQHTWEAQPNNRVLGRTGCPSCVATHASAQEVRLAFELANVLDFDPTRHSFEAAKRVDMVDPARRLVIEFDGSYWHRSEDSLARDMQKSERLRRAGWTVVRVREAPLGVIDPVHDVQVPTNAKAHDSTVAVLEHLANLGLVEGQVAQAYASDGRQKWGLQAEAHLRTLKVKSSRPLRRGFAR